MQITPSDELVSDFATSINSRLNAGGGPAKMKFYTGTKRAKPNTDISAAITAGTIKLLGTATCSATAGALNAGLRRFVFNTILQDGAADDTGTATWASFETVGGVSVLDVDCSTVGGNGFAQMNSTNIIVGGPISVNSCYIEF